MTGGREPVLVAGCDLGKASAKLVVVRAGAAGAFELVHTEHVRHEGRPLEAVAAWYASREVARCAALGSTGVHGDTLGPPVLAGLPEEECLRLALASRGDLAGPLNVVCIGARGYAVLVRDAAGNLRSASSDKCSSGTGENMVRLAERFGLTIEKADEAALAADASIAITARCSVFAKSEMTHFANQGERADRLLRGYFESVARHVAAMLTRVRTDGPIYAIGGCAELRSVLRGLGEALGQEVTVPEGARWLEALGAALAAHRAFVASGGPPLPGDFAALARPRSARIPTSRPARDFAGRVTRLGATAPAVGAIERPTVLGLDLGSTGSKAVLSSVDGKEVVLDVYDRTRGNPVEAAKRLVATLTERAAPSVRAIGVTGSGREAVAAVLRATYPELASRIVVHNEIVAHATAAIWCDERKGESLSIVEIGGQDAKFIHVVGGQIVESNLNQACSAGTGSFLEEQALLHGIDDVTEFARRAALAEAPPDLGQMCTVFVAEAAAEAQRQGFALDDILSGYQYSVIHNYVNRVVGQRVFGHRVFFQGKPAAGESLAWTLAAVIGREVIVPQNPGAMGAFGIGLSAIDLLGREALLAAPAFDLGALASARVTARADFQCKDDRCATFCRIERTTVSLAARTATVFSGGACPKFEVASAGRAKLPMDAPSAFEERAALLARYADEDLEATRGAESLARRVVSVPLCGPLHGQLPFVATFLRELGLGVRVLRSGARSLALGEERCGSYDACAPVKVAHALCDTPDDVLFFPKILDFGAPDDPGGTTCPMEQAMPDLVAHALGALGRRTRVVAPVLRLREGPLGRDTLQALEDAARELGCPAEKAREAASAAAREQERAAKALHEIGARSLAYGQAHGVPVVVVCGPLHTVHDPAVSAKIPALLRDQGALAVPVDTVALPASAPPFARVFWGDARRALRVAAVTRQRGGAFPLWLSSFGCGPGSFNEHAFSLVTEGIPHTILESDGHGGAAGFVTRIQAFLHAVRTAPPGGRPLPPEVVRVLEPVPQPPMPLERRSKVVVFPLADRLSPLIAAAYRAHGYDATAAPAPSQATLKLGKRDCSGKECLPYQQMWGAFKQHLDQAPPAERTLLLQVQGDGACRNCAFSIKDEISLRHHGLEGRARLREVRIDPTLPGAFSVRFWGATVAWSILHQLATYHRPFERTPGEVDALYAGFADALEAAIARPGGEGLRSMAHLGVTLWRAERLVAEASRAFAALGARGRGRDARTVLLSGNIYVRLDESSNDELPRRLSALGLHLVVEPLTLLVEYFAMERSSDLVGLPTDPARNAAFRVGLRVVRDRLYGVARRQHPWLPVPDPTAMIDASRAIIGRFPRGEAPLTIASVLHAERAAHCDGTVLASPWGCGPALLSESILRRHARRPLLVLYSDGSPIDEARLRAFAYRLRALPALAS